MSAAAFLDTNILLYADDYDSPYKRERAENLIRQLMPTGRGRVSMQVLQEYFHNATRKLRLNAAFAQERVEAYMRFDVVMLEPADLIEAINLHHRYQFSIWDALIIHAALIAGCETLYTEDFQHGQRIGNLTILNPF